MAYHPVNGFAPMTRLRQQLPRYAALVLLLWLFATGVAFAHACTSKVHLECEECCAEMKAIEAWSEPVTVSVAAAQPHVPPPAAMPATPCRAPETAAAPWPHAPPGRGGGHDIPIFFLRLAL